MVRYNKKYVLKKICFLFFIERHSVQKIKTIAFESLLSDEKLMNDFV